MSKEYPILFSAPMIQALLARRKTVTRRLSRMWLKRKAGDRLWVRETWACPNQDKSKPGRVAYDADGLCGCWIGGGDDREFIVHGRVLEASGYRGFPEGGASSFGLGKYSDIRSGEYPSYRYGWRPSIHMPRWASRILLEVTEDARVERLQAMTEDEAKAEGVALESVNGPWVTAGRFGSHLAAFNDLWGHLHDKPGERWCDNPGLVRIPFKILEAPDGR